MAEFAQQLLTDHPKEASRAFVPLVELLEGLLDDAVAAGDIQSGLATAASPACCCRRSCSTPSRPRSAAPRCAATPGDSAEELWGLVLGGIAAR